MSTEIYYFSGTGNSLHVARELQQRIPGANLIPVVSLLDKEVIETRAETVGFVFPIHLTTLPIPMREFVKKLDPRSAEYIFAVGTRIGTFCLANVALENMLREKGKRLGAYFILNMANDSPRHGPLLKRLLSVPLAFIGKSTGGSEIPYYADSSCTGCGTCEKACPSKKIRLVDGKPVWQKEVQCYFCYACFNFCPTQSILVGKKYTQKDGRYFHPEITAQDIAGQKQ